MLDILSSLVVSNTGISLIKKYEGFREYAYICPGNEKTIGYGSTRYPDGRKIKLGDRITREKAEEYLKFEIAVKTEEVKKILGKTVINQNQLDALISLTYNIGTGALRRSTLLRKLKEGDYEGAANEFPKWNKANGRVLPGLVKRRKEEKQLFLTPVSVIDIELNTSLMEGFSDD